MSRSTAWTHGRHRAARTAGPAFVLFASLMAVLLVTSPAAAYWTATISGGASAATGSVAAPTGVTAPDNSAGEVPVDWTAGAGGIAPTGYYVTRHTGGTTASACASGPTVLITETDCVDTDVPDGEHSYVVTAVHASWTARSTASPVVLVAHVDQFLGAAGGYSVLAATTVVNTGATTISGDVGVSPGTSITGLPTSAVGGDVRTGGDAAAAQAALVAAYDELSSRTVDHEVAGEVGGLTLTPGVYHSTAALAVTGVLTLDAEGDPDAVFVFQTDAAFDTAAASVVVLVNGARAANVFWVVAGAAGTGANSFLSGTILAQGAITLGAGGELVGQALSRDAVTLSANTIRFTAAPPSTVTIDGGTGPVTKDTTPVITGTSGAPPSSPVTVTVAGQTLSTTVGADGTWSVTPAALAAGAHEVVAKVRDQSGNVSVASQVLTVEVNPSPVRLGAAATYSVLAGTDVVNNGATTLSGDVGSSPGTVITGFPPGAVAGTVHAGDADAANAQGDLLAALDDVGSRALHTTITGDLGGRTFHVGIHHSTAALALTGVLTLDAEGDPDAVFVFRTDAAFNTAAGSAVVLVNGARAANVFWVVAGAAGTGANSSLSGAILARGAITLGAGGELVGQALSRDAVTLSANTITGVTPGEPAAPPSPLAARSSAEETTVVETPAPTSPTTTGSSPPGTTETTPEGTPDEPEPDPVPTTSEPEPAPAPTTGTTEPDGTATP